MKVIVQFTLFITAAVAGTIPSDLLPSFGFGNDVGGRSLDVTTTTSTELPTSGPAVGIQSIRKAFDNSNRNVYVVKQSSEHYPKGGYKFSYKLSDGSFRSEEGEVRNEGLQNQYLFVKGYYGWIGPDNESRQVNYTSGVDGYLPELHENISSLTEPQAFDEEYFIGSIPPELLYSMMSGSG